VDARPGIPVIFTDVEMQPGPTGIELARQVSERHAWRSCRSSGRRMVLLDEFRSPWIER